MRKYRDYDMRTSAFFAKFHLVKFLDKILKTKELKVFIDSTWKKQNRTFSVKLSQIIILV